MRPWLLPTFATTGILAVLSVNLFALPVIATSVAADIGIDAAWIGPYTSVAFGISIFSSMGAGAFIRRWGGLRVGQVCLLLSALAAALVATGALPLIALGAATLGLAFGPETPAASHILARVTPIKERPFVFSLKQTGIQIGGMAAGLVLPLSVLRFGWQPVMLIIGLMSVAMAAAVQPLRLSYDSDRDPAAPLRLTGFKDSLSLVMGTAAMRRFVVAAFTFSALQQSINSFLVVYLVQQLHQPLQAAGMALAVAQVVGIVGRVTLGAIADRWLSAHLLLALLGGVMTAAAAALAATTTAWPLAGLLVVCMIFGVSATGWNGIFIAEVARVAPAGRTSDAIGGMLASAFAGVVVGPTCFGAALVAGMSYQAGFIVLAIASFIGTAALLVPGQRSAIHP